MEKHGEVTLAIDVMFINKIPFVMTTSCNIHFGTAELVKDLKKQYTNNINRPGNTSTSNTWIQDKGNSSRWAIQAHSTTTRAKRNYNKHMHRKRTCAGNLKIHKDSKR